MAEQDSCFKTTHVLDNEIIKANDFEFAFEQLIENVAKATQMLMESEQDFVINGKVLPSSTLNPDMNVKVSPIYGVCKSTGKPFGRTEETDETIGFEGSSTGRVDILEVQGQWLTYDQQQRAFNDPDTDTQTYQYVDTKKLMKPIYQIKKGVDGTNVAPNVDSGWVKLAEITIRANASSITANDIHNITADVAGMDNDDWTNEKTKTYNIGYISDVNARFRVQHNEDGTHAENSINSVSLDIGTGVNQINGNILPVGGAVSIPEQTIASTDSILSVITKAATVITTLYNAYLQYGTWCFNGELKISSLVNNGNLVKPISISAAGDGSAVIKIDGTTVLTITASGQLAVSNSYNATATNHLVTKAVTDAISTALNNLTERVNQMVPQLDDTLYVNGVLSSGSDGRFSVDTTHQIYGATTQNITLYGNQTIDTNVSTGSGNLILVKNQTDPKENGIYESSSSAWSRYTDFEHPSDLKGKIFSVVNGYSNAGRMFYTPKVNFDPTDVFGVDDISFLEYFGSVKPLPSRAGIRDSKGCLKTAEPNSDDDAVSKFYVSPLVVSTNSITGPALKANMAIRVMFTADIVGNDDSTALNLVYNGIGVPLKATKDGNLVNVYAHEISSGTFKYIQAYTTLDIIYNGGNFVIVGNPVVLSGSGYTIYADGFNSVDQYVVGVEVKTNKIWIDGNGIRHSIYRKVIQVNARAISGTNIPTGLPSGSEIINMWVRSQWSTNEGWNNDYMVNDTQFVSQMASVYTISNDGTTLISNSSNGRYVKEVILEYIKPTE